MRKIKFRAWHENVEIMSYYNADDQCFEFLEEDGYRASSDYDIDSAIQSKVIKLMQYTGLKDKNGVEVYEGDILTAGDNITGVMEWHEDQAGFSRFLGEIHQFEIIGNIYEDPELLGDR